MGNGNKTNLSGGDMPNSHTDDATKQSKKPRKKKKDTYGVGGVATGIDSGGSMGGDGGGGE